MGRLLLSGSGILRPIYLIRGFWKNAWVSRRCVLNSSNPPLRLANAPAV